AQRSTPCSWQSKLSWMPSLRRTSHLAISACQNHPWPCPSSSSRRRMDLSAWCRTT
ncbi:hypothetical protein DXG03_003048, partial [Asterophora parasitica]